ncbi:MAG: T9SS type A sorting domain-containing protein [Cyclobacteriaceae bacterium]
MAYFPKNRFPFGFLFFCLFLIFQSGLSAQDIDLSALPKVTNDGVVQRVIPTTDGKYIIVGVFDFIDGKPINRIARLNSDGSLDDTFIPSVGIDNSIYDVLVSDVGEVFLALRDHNLDYRIIKLKSDGSLDDGFIFLANEIVASLAWHSGNIIAGGFFSKINETPVSYLVSISTEGVLNTEFNSNVSNVIPANKIKIQGEKIILIERFGNAISRLNADGSTDDTFQFDIDVLNSMVNVPHHEYDQIAVTDNQIIIHDFANGLIMLDADGVFMNFYGEYRFIKAMDWRGEELVFASSISGRHHSLYKYLLNVETFELVGGSNGQINDVVYNDTNELLIGGIFSKFKSEETSSLAKLNTMGDLDESFNIVGFYSNGSINAITQQGNDKLLIGGQFNEIDGVRTEHLARLNLDGSLDQSFNPFPTKYVSSIEVTEDNKIIVASSHILPTDDYPENGLHLLNPDGSFEQTLHLGSVWGFATVNGKHIISDFLNIFTVDNNVPEPFLTDSNPNRIHRFTKSNEGTIFIAAEFKSGDTFYLSINSYLPDGSTNPNFKVSKLDLSGNTNPSVGALTVGPDGKIWVGGRFDKVDEQEVSRGLIRLNQDGSLDTSFNTNGSGTQSNTILYNSDYSIIDYINIMNDGAAIVSGRYISLYNEKEVNKTFIVTSHGQLSNRPIDINASGSVITGMALKNNRYLYGGYFNHPGSTISTALGILDLSIPIEEDPITAVEDFENHSPLIYPNPVSDYLTIDLPDQGLSSFRFSIYSLTGQRVAVPDVPSSSNSGMQIDVRSLPSGMYVLKGTSRAGNLYRKFIKQ